MKTLQNTQTYRKPEKKKKRLTRIYAIQLSLTADVSTPNSNVCGEPGLGKNGPGRNGPGKTVHV